MKRKAIYIAGMAIGIAWVGTAAADVTLFQGDRFNGGRITVHEATPNFDRTRFDNRARSAVVTSGRWEICAEADFRGDCKILEPGRYSDLGAFTGRLSSLRPVSDWNSADCEKEWQERGNRDNDNRGDRDDRGEARATLYEGKGFSGHSFDVQNGMLVNLIGSGFNDRVSSLRVDSGYWVFCSGSEFSGECRTFGPGDYDVLPNGFNNRITSGRW